MVRVLKYIIIYVSIIIPYYPGAAWGSNLFINYEWPMNLFNLNCTGYESTIWDCSYNSTDNTGLCQQNSDASVFCMSKREPSK